MKKSIVILAGLIVFFCAISPVHGQSTNQSMGRAATEKPITHLEVLFQIGQSQLDLDFQNNRVNLLHFISELNNVVADTNYVVGRLVVVGTASPDGEESVNIALAGKRAQSLAKYLQQHASIAPNHIEVVNGGENWMGLRLMMEASKNMPLVAVADDSIVMARQAVVAKIEPLSPKPFRPIVALKTDLMLWGGVMPDFKMGSWTPNLSAEVYFARRWSVQAGYAYSNWGKFTGTKELYALSVADMEVRHWFGKRSQFKGFYLGVYGQYGQYDVQKGIKGETGSFWGAGLGAGWMQPLSRHWALEAEVRGGYRSAQNDIYDIEQGHFYFNNNQNNGKFTPQFRLQVVYRIGKKQK